MKKKFFLLSFVFVLAGCNVVSDTNPTVDLVPPVVQVETKTLVTSFYPLAFLAEQVGGENIRVVNLAGVADVHEYTPSPQDMVQLNTADLVIFQGAGLEPWLQDIIPELAAKNIQTLEVSHAMVLATMEQHEDHGEAGDDHGAFDPHTWLDPVLAQDMIDIITLAIASVSPEDKNTLEARAEKLKNRFALLDENYRSALSQCEQNEVIVSHDAFGYVARRYGFEIHAIAGISTQDEPSAKILAELKDEAATGMTHILVEENNIRRFADTLSLETGLSMLPINPLGRGTLDPKKDFFNIAEENLESFKTALNCQ